MNLLLPLLVGLLAGVVTYLFGGYVGVSQPLLGIVALVVFAVVAFGYRGHLGHRI